MQGRYQKQTRCTVEPGEPAPGMNSGRKVLAYVNVPVIETEQQRDRSKRSTSMLKNVALGCMAKYN